MNPKTAMTHDQNRQLEYRTDLEKLDNFLSSEGNPESSMASICLGQCRTGVQAIDERIWATQAVLARYNDIAKALSNLPADLEPIF